MKSEVENKTKCRYTEQQLDNPEETWRKKSRNLIPVRESSQTPSVVFQEL